MYKCILLKSDMLKMNANSPEPVTSNNQIYSTFSLFKHVFLFGWCVPDKYHVLRSSNLMLPTLYIFFIKHFIFWMKRATDQLTELFRSLV